MVNRDEIAALMDGATPGHAELLRRLERWGSGALGHHWIGKRSAAQDCLDAGIAIQKLQAIATAAIATLERETARVATARADALREAAAVVDALNRQGPYQAIIAGREILALIDSPAPAAALVAWVQARGITIQEMRANLLASEDGQKLYQQGDCTLVWVSEGDLSVLSMLRAQADMATPDEGWVVGEDGAMMPEDVAAKVREHGDAPVIAIMSNEGRNDLGQGSQEPGLHTRNSVFG